MADAFTAVYEPGPAWEAGTSIERQPGFAEQLLWWKEHAKVGRLKMVGILAERPEVVVMVCYGAAEDVDRLLAASPLVASGRLKVSITPGAPKPC